MMLATLAERYDRTQFKEFQKETISNVLGGRDTLVVQPTGSGKVYALNFLLCTNKRRQL